MTYTQLFYLKFKKGLPTCELIRRFPKELNRVSEVALLEVPEETLKEIFKGKKGLRKLMRLKQKLTHAPSRNRGEK